MTQQLANLEEIEEHISNIAVELYEANLAFHEKNDTESSQIYIENYIKQVTRIAFKLKKSNLTALRDSCVIFHEILEDIHQHNATLTEQHLTQFEVWPTLVLAYISDTNDANNIESLLTFLQDDIWSYTADEGDFKQLKDAFYESVMSNNENNAPASTSVEEIKTETNSTDDENQGAFDGALFESVQEEIIDAMTGLISDLSSVDEGDDFGLSHAFYLCADRIELLGMSIATAGLMGLMDVCMIFQNGLRQLAQREKALTEEEQIIIEEWTSHLIAYLTNPTNEEIVNHLVDYLNNMPWSDKMSEEEVMTLRFMLIPEDIEVTAPEVIEDFTEDLSEKNDQIKEEELVYEMDDAEGLEDISVSEDMYFLGQELIQLIHDEFELEQVALDEAIVNIQADTNLNDENIEQFTKFSQMIERLALATDSIGLTGLNKILTFLVENLNSIKDNNIIDNGNLIYLKGFSKLALQYLSDLDNKELINILASPLAQLNWPNKFDHEIKALEKELLSPRLMIEDDIEIRATQATVEDVSIKLPEDVNQQLLSTLLQELPVQAEEFTQSITQIVEGNASLRDVEKAQRIAHTLKGAANTVGIVGIATLTHHIEDIFNIFTEQKRFPSKNLADTLMNAADVLEMMSEALLGLGEAPDQAQNVLQQILDWANLLDQEGIPDDDAQIELSSNAETTTSKEPDDTSHLNDMVAETMLRVPATLMDELLRIAGESIILGGQVQERLRKATEQTKLVHEQNLLYQQLVFELEHIVDVQGLSSKKSDFKEDEVFDSLEMEHYNELHTVTHRLVEAATDSKELTHNIEDELNSLDTLLVDQGRLHKDNQNIVMQTRMVPVQNVVPRLQRSIRQTSRSTSKKVNLDVTGSETLMDSDVLNDLIDPLMHILRNAVDHGIESESNRTSKGKNVAGNIRLEFFRDGDHIVVRCVDDGAGLDFNAIRKTAIKKKFATEDQDLSEDELVRLIWLPGFTTRDTTTQVSGRGIGMDAVYNQITSMKGTINITSKKGLGCTVELKLPVTLISVHAILTKLRKQTIAISNRGIEQILCNGDGVLKNDNDSYTYELNGESYKTFDIETLLHQPRDQRDNDREERTVFIVSDETGFKYAVTVEHVIANQDLIVKQLGTYIPDIIGIEGATILGDGSVAPVLDLPGLIRTAVNKDISPLIEQRLADAVDIDETLTALVIDDSLSARRSLAEFIKDIGYEVRTARDGIEAIELLETKTPDIILVDMEMPRMNGLEFTSHIRSKAATKNTPVIMITSRTTEKHRDMADAAGVNAYLTKPFVEDELLENIQNLLLAVH